MKFSLKNLKSKIGLLFITSLLLAQFAFSAKDQFVRVVNDNTNHFST